jgi:glycosyltransferase involved in cell wall biosynthesis
MKAILIDQYFPDIKRDSGSIDTVNYLNALNTLGYEVFFSTLHKGSAILEKNIRDINVNIIQPENLLKWIFKNHESIDVIVVFRYQTANACIDLIENFCSKAKKIFYTSDLHFLREERSLALGKGHNSNASNVRKIEIDLMYRFDATIVVSSYEKELIKSIDSDINVIHIPLTRDYVGTEQSWASRSKKVGFIGGYNHTPNTDAVENIVNNILPRLRLLDLDIKIVLAGSNMPDQIKNLSIAGLEQIGFVDELHNFFDQLKCSIAPLRFGAGEKGKVLSSLAHSLPVISSSIGAESICNDDKGIGVIVEDDPQRFAEAIFRICNDQIEFDILSNEAMQFSKNRNSETTFLKLKEIIKSNNKRESIELPSEVLLTVILLTRDLAKANKNIINSWRNQVLNNKNSELLILDGGESSDNEWAHGTNIKIYQNKDVPERYNWGIIHSRGKNIQFATDDDLIQIEKVNNLVKTISYSNYNYSLINDFLIYGKSGNNIYKQNFQYYSGTNQYAEFCRSMGAIPAFYSCFPKSVVQKWMDFTSINKIIQPYSDWLLLLCAFLNSTFKYTGRSTIADIYNIDNWNGHYASEKSLIHHMKDNNYDVKLIVFLDLLWMYHSYMLIQTSNLKSKQQKNELLTFIWKFFFDRFVNNLPIRAMIVELSEEDVNLFKYFSDVLNSNLLNFKFLYDCLIGFLGILNENTSLRVINSLKLIDENNDH